MTTTPEQTEPDELLPSPWHGLSRSLGGNAKYRSVTIEVERFYPAGKFVDLQKIEKDLLNILNTPSTVQSDSVARGLLEEAIALLKRTKVCTLHEDEKSTFYRPMLDWAVDRQTFLNRIKSTPSPSVEGEQGDVVTLAKSAVEDVAAERKRQIEQEDWNDSHDDTHIDGQLAKAAACYAHFAALPDFSRETINASLPDVPPVFLLRWWPWDRDFWKPKDRRHDLIRAGALIVAEIERLDRATKLQAALNQRGVK